jgi:hypothetical protein
MTAKRIYLYIATLIIGLHSCQSIVTNVDLPQINVEPVVHFRYDKAINMYDCSLTKSNPIFGDQKSEFEVIEDAMVTITGIGKTDTLLYVDDLMKYKKAGSINFIDGEMYNLEVKMSDGSKAQAQSKFPVRPQNVDVVIDSFKKDFETVYRVRTSWDDIPGITDYYMLEFYQVYNFDGEKDTFGSEVARLAVGDDSGTRFTKQHEAYAFTEPGSSFSVNMFVVLSGITKKQYDYLDFLERYEPENPFTEPTTIPSNIQGGLGMFTLKNSVLVKL